MANLLATKPIDMILGEAHEPDVDGTGRIDGDGIVFRTGPGQLIVVQRPRRPAIGALPDNRVGGVAVDRSMGLRVGCVEEST